MRAVADERSWSSTILSVPGLLRSSTAFEMEIDPHRVVHQGWGRDFNIIDPAGRALVRAKLSWWTGRRAAFDVEGKGYIAYRLDPSRS
jgi:hypothetical protein